MSIAVLASHDPNASSVPNHDQFDDLESFYCVMYDLMCSWEGVGRQVQGRPTELELWDVNSDPTSTCIMKKSHYLNPHSPNIKPIPRFWLPASVELLTGFYKLVRSLVLDKLSFSPLNSAKKRDGLRAMLGTADAVYDEVIALFDNALEELSAQETPLVHGLSHSHSASPDTQPSSKAPVSEVPHHPLKRIRPASVEDELPATKRSRRKLAIPRPPYSPPRTRAASKAAIAAAKKVTEISVPLPTSIHDSPRPSQRSIRKTRTAAKSAPLHDQACLTTAGSRNTSRKPKKPSSVPTRLEKGSKSIKSSRNRLLVAGSTEPNRDNFPPPTFVRLTRASAKAGFGQS